MAKESNLELKVGAFVLLAFVVAIGFIFSISDFSAFEKGKTFRAIFGFANGLRKASPVRLAGVDVGSVKDIGIFFDKIENKTKVRVDIWVRMGTVIPRDSRIWINQLGLLGEKYLEIIPGQDTAQFINDNDMVVGEDPVAMEQISAKMNDLGAKLEKTVEGINLIVQNPKNQQAIEDILTGTSMIVNNVKSGRGTVGKLLYDDVIFSDLEGLTGDLKANPWKLLYRPRTMK